MNMDKKELSNIILVCVKIDKVMGGIDTWGKWEVLSCHVFSKQSISKKQ